MGGMFSSDPARIATDSQTKQKQNQKTTSGPLAGTESMWDQLWSRGMGAMGNVQGNPFMGPFVTGANPLERQGAQALAAGPGNEFMRVVNSFQNMAGDTLGGKFLMPGSNPFLSANVEAAIRPMEGQFQGALDAISDRAIAQGAYGGSGQSAEQVDATNNYTTAVGDISSRMYGENFARERQNQMMAGSFLPVIQKLLQAPAEAQLTGGGLLRGFDDLTRQNTEAAFREQQASQFRGLPEMLQLLATPGFRSGTSKGTSTSNTHSETDNPNAQSGFEKLLGTGIGLAASVAGLGGPAGFGMWGAGSPANMFGAARPATGAAVAPSLAPAAANPMLPSFAQPWNPFAMRF